MTSLSVGVYGIAHRELYTCAALSSHWSTYSLDEIGIHNEGTQRAFAESIAANPLFDLQRVDLSPYMNVLGVSDGLRGNQATYKHNGSRSSE
jgi:hypothetical protein